MDSWLGLESKIIIVTGGSSGIGNEIVNNLLDNGAVVYNADLKNSEVNNEKYNFLQVDVTNRDIVQNAVDEVYSKEGKIDVLINNAGINLPRVLVDEKEEHPEYEINNKDLDFMFDVNLKGPIWFSQAVLNILFNKNMATLLMFQVKRDKKVLRVKVYIQQLKLH